MSEHNSKQSCRVGHHFMPSRKSPCLCGSGKKFKNCCADMYLGRRPGVRTRQAINEGDYKKALLECRADITQYTIWHKRHTEPAVRAGVSEIQPLLTIDIKALSELVDLLFRCYAETNRSDQFPAVLERLRLNIDDPRWQRKIVYFHAVNALWPDWDEAAGMYELRKLGSMEDEIDVEILQLYIDLNRDALSFSENIAYIERIIKYSETPIDRLHYRGCLGLEYFLIGDEQKAESELEQGIGEFRSTKNISDMDVYEVDILARLLNYLGSIRNDGKLFNESVKLYKSLVDREEWTDKGRASVWRNLGDAYKNMNAWQEAYDANANARKLDESDIYLVFMSESLLYLNESGKASELISKVEVDTLNDSEYNDYAFILAGIAVESGDKELLAKVQCVLQRLRLSESYFRGRRDALLLEVIYAQNSGASKSVIQRVRMLILEFRKGVAKYLILQPNFMGLGVDVGRMLDDVSSGSDKHLSESPSKDTKPKQ